MRLPIQSSICFLLSLIFSESVVADPARDAEAYAEAVKRINESHASRPGDATEADLGRKMPASALTAVKRVVDSKDDASELADSLATCAEAALDLDLMTHFEAIRKRLAEISPQKAAEVGTVVSRERFIIRGIGAFKEGYLEQFADVFDAVLTAYDEVFAFSEFSKVPGKKLRVRVHLEEKITRPPHFAPQFPFHSEIDFPVIDPEEFKSPTPQGQFLFYGLCHELGHVIAMWGDLKTMEDYHAWAHYTGVAIVEHLASTAKDKPFMRSIVDMRYGRTLAAERDKAGTPSVDDREGVMAMLIGLHDAAGPESIGAAMNQLDEKGRHKRVNHVRYYAFDDFKRALGDVIEDRDRKKAALDLFP